GRCDVATSVRDGLIFDNDEEGRDLWADPLDLTFGPDGEDFLFTYHKKLDQVLVEASTQEGSRSYSATLRIDPDTRTQTGHIQKKARKKRERSGTCSFCNIHFSRASDAVRHENTVHMGKTYKCSQCDNEFSRKDAFQRHMKKRHQAKPTPMGEHTSYNTFVTQNTPDSDQHMS
ncbi:hypothetical protein BJV74DRAFT_404306, partial [Russula compacta]